MASHNELGRLGENLAVDYLIREGYTIKNRNWRYQKAEIDIIAQKEDVLVAIEVKTRTSNYFGNPQDFVNPKKIKLLLSAIDNFVVERDLDVDVRFDIIAIIKQSNKFEIEHII